VNGFVPNAQITSGAIQPFSIPTGALRAPGANGTSFVMQGFVDEIAVAAGKDPLQFRLDLLNNPVPAAGGGGGAPGGRGGPGGGGGFGGNNLVAQGPPQGGRGGAPGGPGGGAPAAGGRGPGGGGGGNQAFATRARGVVEKVRAMSNWDVARPKLPKGTGMGVAFQFSHSGYVAYVVQVTVDSKKAIKVDKVWCAVDIGSQIVNPSSAKNLIHGGFIEGMSHVMAWEIPIEGGRVAPKNLNFDTYQLTRMSQVPVSIDVEFVMTNNAPTGLGEPSLPPAIPAIVNAIAHATGERIRTLPIRPQGYSWAT
jgi:isoquinoline 1-oxidoreductase beta subunit